MHRFYLENFLDKNIELELKYKDLINQFLSVLRFKLGEKIIFFDGKNYVDFVYEIIFLDKKSIRCKFVEKIEKKDLNKEKITLYQSFPNKLSKIEYILQKGVEVGITNFVFFKANRTQKIINFNEQRLKKIVIEAVEQSGNSIIPEVLFSTNGLEKNISKNGLNLYFHTKNNNSELLKNLNFSGKNLINLYVGPEGGFDDLELRKFSENDFIEIYLGNSILRTETVGVVVGFFINQTFI